MQLGNRCVRLASQDPAGADRISGFDGKVVVSETHSPSAARGERWSQLWHWARRCASSRNLAVALAVAAVVSGFATYVAVRDYGPLGLEPASVVPPLLLVNLVILLALGAFIARRLVRLWVERRRGSAGSRIHGRLAVLFSVVAVAPTIIIAVFSALFLNYGIHDWFNERVKSALSTSVVVAEAYMQEHGKLVRGDALAMVNDLNDVADAYYRNPLFYNRVLSTQVALRRLSEAIVFDPRTGLIARSALSYTLDYREIPAEAIEAARSNEGEPILFARNSELVRALVKLRGPGDAFLYAGRAVDPRVIAHVEENRRAVTEYQRAEGERAFIQVTFVMAFIVVALLLLLAAVWLGLAFANRLVAPIGSLINAADRVRGGTFNVKVPELPDDDEIGVLVRSFNRMTGQLDIQRGELVEANRQLDLRRRFTEAVLAGVTSGVVGLDADGTVTLPNQSASALLEADPDAIVGRKLAEIVPEMGSLLREIQQRPERTSEGHVTIERGGRQRNLLVRIGAQQADGRKIGYVVTFDDVTELVSAQRAAAWSEIARRIAHEIKNPLTPIQLSAERLKRKYLGEIASDPSTFSTCTDTIIRHALDIGRMVDEFSSFARMPTPDFKSEDIVAIARRAVVLERMAHGEIRYLEDLPEGAILIACDGAQMGRVFTNLLKNAAEAIAERGDAAPPGWGGEIRVRIVARPDEVEIVVADNGVGLPRAQRDRITEPYVTTREKGTGLGLAIVKKILDDHGGRLELADRKGGGAEARILVDRLTVHRLDAALAEPKSA